ncbi:16S rRNA (cytosine(1402)-N(4))-methyltransferase RsmH, partial [Candidatus Falkowbacteria bacterium]|nr:16S rRNA (cytosine(1402)-N(4))-methyltransferase RsmH [Candidatus Falkowbacteria bacterium]
MAEVAKHIPVLLNEVIKFLDPKPNQNFIDCTLGAGGHTIEILKRIAPNGKVLGIDMDMRAILVAKQKVLKAGIPDSRLVAVRDNYKNLKEIVLQNNFKNISGILVDLGFSSMEIEDPKKGFSFKIDAPLDMRYGEEGMTAAEIINHSREKELERIFQEYGEEKFSGRIAKKICEIRKDNPIDTTFKLVNAIAEVVPKKFQFGRVHFATKVFQALRIATNNEIENLKEVLPEAAEILSPGGRLAIISFHSLEDRIVKQYFKKESSGCLCPKDFPTCQCGHKAILKILNKKPIVPSEEEA